MSFVSNIQQFLSDLRAQKLRSTLTILGITWGTVSVVVLLAFGVGLQKQSKINMHGMGQGIVVLFPNKTTKAFMGYPDGRWVHFTTQDAEILKSQVPEIDQISPEFRKYNTPVHYGINRTLPCVVGANSEYGDMRNIIPQEGGRYINQLDIDQRRRVVVLGDKIKALLLGDKPAIGQKIYIGQSPFTVIGVMQPKVQSSSYGERDQDCLFIPISTYQSLFGDKYLNNLIFKYDNPEMGETIKNKVYKTLSRVHKFDQTDKDAVFIWDTNDMDKFMNYFFIGFNIFMGIIGSFTLTVGGIGVANIMFVVVKEKTREIGIKRSIGATRKNIMLQFFLESFSIVLIGAFFGFLISLGITEIAQLLPIKEYVGTPEISIRVILATATLLSLIAFLAGFFPARRASQLEPVDCLRYGV
ncbi:MAG TPA: ABC transporter permease [Balneolales bacterium]|nr:ABC transporter permease [Balneolales bacterium]